MSFSFSVIFSNKFRAIPHKEHLSHNLCVILPVKAAFAEWIDEQGEDYESQADDIIREWEEYEPDED